MNQHIYRILLVLVLFGTTVQAQESCNFMVIEDYSVIADGFEWRHIVYGWVCYNSGSGGGDLGGPGGGGSTLPQLPSVRIISASDENPQQVELRFDYSGGGVPTSMILRKNGAIVSSGPPSSFGLYGSLDNMIFDSILTVTMCNAAGCGDDSADVRRRTERPRAEGAISAQWQDFVPIDPFNITIVVGYESYTRILEAELFYADYSVPTSGARNGRVKHVQTTDALLWENGKRAPEWTTSYRLVPSWAWWEVSETGSETAGCWLPQNRFPNESPRCTIPGEFGRDGSPGVGAIQRVIASGSGFADPSAAFGALELAIWP